MNRISHWIDGKVVEGTSGRSGVVFDPATGQQQASVDLASLAGKTVRLRLAMKDCDLYALRFFSSAGAPK